MDLQTGPRLSVVVPCLNEEEVLPVFYEAVTAALGPLALSYELLFVDDGSTDGTLDVLRALAERDGRVVYVSLSRNFGKEGAMYAGLCGARGEYVAIMDADLQDPPELLPRMLALLDDGVCDCVAARRVTRQGEPRVRSFFARQFYRLINAVSDADIADGARDYRVMRRRVADVIVAMGEYNRFSKGIFGWVGFRTRWLEYENVERAAGETKWSFWALVRYALDGLINFSQAPLTIASWSGILFTAAAFVMLVFIVVRKLLFGDPVAGWASTVCIIIFVGGVQMFCLGIMGQYLSKTYLETKRRPNFIVAETNGAGIESFR